MPDKLGCQVGGAAAPVNVLQMKSDARWYLFTTVEPDGCEVKPQMAKSGVLDRLTEKSTPVSGAQPSFEPNNKTNFKVSHVTYYHGHFKVIAFFKS